MKKSIISIGLCIMVLSLPSFVLGYEFVDRSTRQHETLVVDGVERNFYYELPLTEAPPEGYKAVIGLHGAAMGYESWYREGTLMIIMPNFRNPMDTQNMYLTVKWMKENGYVFLMPDSLQDPKCGIPLRRDQKGWDLQGLTMDTNHDYPFMAAMLDWLADDAQVNVNMDRVVAFGICNGAAFVAGLLTEPELSHRFSGFVIGAGGYPRDVPDGVIWGVERCGENGFDCDADIDIPANTRPTIVGVGSKDRVMPTEFVLNLHRNIEEAGVPTVRMGEDWPTLYPGHSYPLNMEQTFMDWLDEQYEILGM